MDNTTSVGSKAYEKLRPKALKCDINIKDIETLPKSPKSPKVIDNLRSPSQGFNLSSPVQGQKLSFSPLRNKQFDFHPVVLSEEQKVHVQGFYSSACCTWMSLFCGFKTFSFFYAMLHFGSVIVVEF